jgi:hypothetical protein
MKAKWRGNICPYLKIQTRKWYQDAEKKLEKSSSVFPVARGIRRAYAYCPNTDQIQRVSTDDWKNEGYVSKKK